MCPHNVAGPLNQKQCETPCCFFTTFKNVGVFVAITALHHVPSTHTTVPTYLPT